MKINSITLENFGSYEGVTTFDTREENGKNIILIGGKNGAGKTTLFNAMRLCLYGFMSMGYKNHNVYYSRAVTKFINNTAKITKPAKAGVYMDIYFSNGHEMDRYLLQRSWVLSDTLVEEYKVIKNDIELTAEEIADFDKFLLNIIPPELFNLYFFDGEKIADFFLDEGSNARIKAAFLTLCGYDTFEIMSKNFKRLSLANSGSSASALSEYLGTKVKYQTAHNDYQITKSEYDKCIIDAANCEADIKELDTNYARSGGVSQSEWNEYLAALKLEEKKREANNAWIKKIANEYLPFLIIKDQVVAVEKQLLEENNNRKYSDFCEVLESSLVKDAVIRLSGKQSLAEIKSLAYVEFGNKSAQILDFSFESGASVLSSTRDILSFDEDKIIKVKKTIKSSINKSAKIRKKLDECNIDSVQNYMQQRNELLEKQTELLNERIRLSELLLEKEKVMVEFEIEFKKSQILLEEELKKESINDVSAKAILMLDKLQMILYHKQIEKIEAFFRDEINKLMRKTRFIDDIYIDDEFNIHIYRGETFDATKIISVLESHRDTSLEALAAVKTLKRLKEATKCSDLDDIISYFKLHRDVTVNLPVEIDKTLLSNGEKQIFIMALYHSLVQLCNHEVPFVIDTPFARIDTEHRHNISKYFFSKLNGQVFILSTNEEINAKHVKIMENKIAKTYVLENVDNVKTTVIADAYFKE